MEEDQMPPEHAVNLVAKSGNTAYQAYWGWHWAFIKNWIWIWTINNTHNLWL